MGWRPAKPALGRCQKPTVSSLLSQQRWDLLAVFTAGGEVDEAAIDVTDEDAAALDGRQDGLDVAGDLAGLLALLVHDAAEVGVAVALAVAREVVDLLFQLSEGAPRSRRWRRTGFAARGGARGSGPG